ncbi:hypothetical protein E2C01_101844 [Portunus trituberculatus]|uniref:Uncharacterized protein n=1 Tax=Portunus trituberculatus TaxID=210409 RepID=A0A5B7KBP1_PORTR|nr:hypothetical protein [Portunus trituberculatus]
MEWMERTISYVEMFTWAPSPRHSLRLCHRGGACPLFPALHTSSPFSTPPNNAPLRLPPSTPTL